MYVNTAGSQAYPTIITAHYVVHTQTPYGRHHGSFLGAGIYKALEVFGGEMSTVPATS